MWQEIMKQYWTPKTKYRLALLLQVIYLIWLASGFFYKIMYAVCVVLCLAGFWTRKKLYEIRPDFTKRERVGSAVIAAILAFSVILSEYDVFAYDYLGYYIRLRVILMPIYTVAGFATIHPIVMYLLMKYRDLPEISISAQSQTQLSMQKKTAKRFFLISFLSTMLCYVTVWVLGFFPGVLSNDSFWQIDQAFGVEPFSNHHPFYHTMLITLTMRLGYFLFHDMNLAVACYMLFQMIAISLISAYTTMTVYEATNKKAAAIGCILWFTLYPTHIIYSFTMWKDILWAYMCLLFMTSLYRKQLGSTNLVLLFISALGVCLLRSNGLFVFVFVYLFYLIFVKEKKRSFVLSLGLALLLAILLKGPVLGLLDVERARFLEPLAIPSQQITMVVAEEKELKPDEEELLSNVVDLEELKEVYHPHTHDPVKYLIQAGDGETYLEEHKWEFAKLWLDLGLRYPVTYLKAWVEQTKGYWNLGIANRSVMYGVRYNDYGIETYCVSERFASFVRGFADLVTSNTLFPIFTIFGSVGLITWINAIAFTIFMIMKRRDLAMLCMLPLATVLSLMIATPVMLEFRYSYNLFTTIPVILLLLFRRIKE